VSFDSVHSGLENQEGTKSADEIWLHKLDVINEAVPDEDHLQMNESILISASIKTGS